MSTENLKVVYDPQAETASFNVSTRELRLPVYKDFAEEATDMFVGHEVGHALYTPSDEASFKAAVDAIDSKNPQAVHTFLNVVEDVRIDRLIKNKYPGIRRCYSIGSAELVKHDLFGLREQGAQPLAEMPMIDRINIHFKAGIYGTLPVLLNEREQAFADRMEAAETWDDVVAVTKDLYEAESELLEKMAQQAQQTAMVPVASNKGEQGNDPNSPSDAGDIRSEEVDEQNDDNGTLAASGIDNRHNRKRPRPVSTQEKYEQAKSRKIDSKADAYDYYEIPTPNLDNIVIPFSTILADLNANRDANKCQSCWIGDSLYEKYRQSNLPAVRIMARTFERKQSAILDARTLISKTGVIDPNTLHSFRFNDDIFIRNEELPNGKKHGMVIYVDWSSSMGGTMLATVQQVLALADFCDMVRIPYEVYAFSAAIDERVLSRQERADWRKMIGKFWNGFATTTDQYGHEVNDANGKLDMSMFHLLNLLSSKMSKSDRVAMQKHLLVMGAAFDGSLVEGVRYYFPLPSLYNLSSTPLDEAVVCSFTQIPAFMREHGVQVMNTVFITDGGSGSGVVQDRCHNNIVRLNGEDILLQPCNSYYTYTNSLLGILKRKTGCNIINFELVCSDRGARCRFDSFTQPCFTQTTRSWRRSYNTRRPDAEKFIANMHKQYEDKGYAIVENYGFIDAFVIMPGRTGLVESETFDQVVEGATTITKIKSAFVKSASNSVNTRFMLNHMGGVFASQL
jgi:hypothetical protein